MKTLQSRLIKAGPTMKASPEQLLAEYQVHLGQARHYLRKALEAEEIEAPGVSTLFLKAQIEQNAALLCQGQGQVLMLGALISIISEFTGDEDEGDAEEGAMQ